MTRRTISRCTWIAALTLLCAPLAFSAEPAKSADAAASPEVRQQMAAVHEKMAQCLRSERPMAECRAEMVSSCQQMMGASGCPMMGSGAGGMGPGMMGGGKGMHGGGMMGGGTGGGMMKGTPAPETPEKK
jgi:hypothetical protein